MRGWSQGHGEPSSLFGFSIPDSLYEWWKRAEASPEVELYVNYGIGAAYALLGVVALIQLVRIQLRVPEFGWTTQKVFHACNCMVAVLRASTFFFRAPLDDLRFDILRILLLDLPGLLFFTTYTLLVLFWAEIYHQARSMPTGYLRPLFYVTNTLVYLVQGGLWALNTYGPTEELQDYGYTLSHLFLAVVSISAAAGFLLYGGRLFLMLQRFPIESRGRKKKLREVGLVTFICASCFGIRAAMVCLSALDRRDMELDLLRHPLLNLLYYTLAEIFPSACVLYILRKLPPKRSNAQGYQQLPSQEQTAQVVVQAPQSHA